MDKLQPIIKHRFWILAGLVVPLAIYGHFSANAALQEQTAERTNKIEEIKRGVSSGHSANEEFSRGLEHLNQTYETWVNEVLVDLWNKQRERMTWPSNVIGDGKPPEGLFDEFGVNPRTIYKRIYPALIEDLERSVEPVMPRLERGMPGLGNFVSESGNVTSNVPWKQKVILHAQTPRVPFGEVTITSQEMWDAQIDLWLTRILYEAIRNVNEDKESVTEANIRRIDHVELVGGDGNPVLTGQDQEGGGDPEMGDMMSGMGARTAGQAVEVVSSIEFSPEQEFGPALPGGGGPGGGEFFDDEGGGFGDSAGAAELRWLGSPEEQPYRERGFYMSVVIMQNKIPDFLTELANAPWPTRVERFSVGANPYLDTTARSGRRTGIGMDESRFSPRGGGMRSPRRASPMISFGARGGRGFGMGMDQATGPNPLSQNLPEYAHAALQHPDLVVLNVCGVITIYNRPTEALEALAALAQQQGGEVPEVPDAPTEAPPEESVDALPVPEESEENPFSPPNGVNDDDAPETATEAAMDARAADSAAAMTSEDATASSMDSDLPAANTSPEE